MAILHTLVRYEYFMQQYFLLLFLQFFLDQPVFCFCYMYSSSGNRKHFHPDADENWVILDGEWEWWIEGQGSMVVKKNDIIVVPAKTWHKITCISGPGIRYAITQPDVEHVYE